MPVYKYKALTESGQTVSGTLEAADRSKALAQMARKGLHAFNFEETQDGSRQDRSRSFSLSVGRNDLILFTRQMANLLSSGIQLGEALKIISRILKAGRFKDVISDIHQSLESGAEFASTLEKHSTYFPQLYISMVRSGAEGGFLASTFKQLALNLEEQKKMRSFIISSLIYPLFLMVVALFAVIFMLSFVLPKFMVIYSNYGESLPRSTEMLLKISRFLSNYGLFIILTVAFVLLAVVIFYFTEAGRKFFDQIILKLPVLGSVSSQLAVARTARVIGLMLGSGVPLLKSLHISQQVAGNYLFGQAIQETAEGVRKGSKFSDALDRTGIFPELAVYMVGVGEQTGKLDEMLQQVAESFESESRASLDKMLRLFEPFLILLMGLMVGSIVISMILPVLNLNTFSF